MIRTVGVLAHVDAGKTTLCEQLLFRAGALRDPGRVDHGSAFMDQDPIERRRGITIFSGQARFAWSGEAYILLDTPGHTDFSAEMERALSVLDLAVVVVSGTEGIQGHTEMILDMLVERRIPVFFFINKMDLAGADSAAVTGALSRRLPGPALDFSALGKEDLPPALLEPLAELDETLLERYLEDNRDSRGWTEDIRRLIGEQRLFPAFAGAALAGKGVEALLEGMNRLAPRPAFGPGCFTGRVYQIRHDEKGRRLTFVRVLSGSLAVKDPLDGQKVDEIRLYHGAQYRTASRAETGELCALLGLEGMRPGQGLGVADKTMPGHPVLKTRALWNPEDRQAVLAAFALLQEEDPALQVEWDGGLSQLTVQVMGEIQLEILRQLLEERFHLEVAFAPCEIAYRETLRRPAVGIGHYEPLRHYAEVHLLLEPGPRGSGITYENRCPPDTLPVSYQSLVKTHVFERKHRGVLTGSPLTDVKITLLAGRAHLKHTEGGDFRQAVYRAIRQGLAKAESLLLEPYYSFTIDAPAQALGRILADVQRLNGSFDPPVIRGDRARLQGRGPVACFRSYAAQLPAITQGRGRWSAAFGGYEPCHNADEVIAGRGYSMGEDRENTADSVFCAKGAGFMVSWRQADAYAHISREEYAGILREKGVFPDETGENA